MVMSGRSGGRASEKYYRADLLRYRAVTLEQIRMHREFGRKALKWSILSGGVSLLVLFLLIPSEFRTHSFLFWFAVGISVVNIVLSVIFSRRAFRQAKNLEQELNERVIVRNSNSAE